MPTNASSTSSRVLFDEIRWRDPLDGRELEPVITARGPSGVPICGALRRPGTNYGYPIVDSIVRLTSDLAHRYRDWLAILELQPPPCLPETGLFQPEDTVDSFGFQWNWNSQMRSEADLEWRVARRFQVDPRSFRGKLALDAGAGAGDQSRWLIRQGARVVSIDLSSAIDAVARKLRAEPNWVGVQGDITVLPFASEQFQCVYCEGVIQHTRDSARTVQELSRVTRPGGMLLATHYGKSTRWLGRMRSFVMGAARNRLSHWDRYKLLLLTGTFAAAAYIPLLGRLVRASGAAVYYDLMPDFKTTWTNTFDNYGNHAYQRYVSADEFWSYFQTTPGLERVFSEDGVIAVRKSECERAERLSEAA